MELKQIGRGSHRRVYINPDNPTQVIKKPVSINTLQNQNEWLAWQRYKDTELADYLCPCISYDGHSLIQMRAEPLVKNKLTLLLDRLPQIHDVKIKNCGLLNHKIVIVDYGGIKQDEIVLPVKKRGRGRGNNN